MTETMLDRLMKAACEARIGHEKCQCLDREGAPEAGSVTADVTCLSEISWQVNAVLEVLTEPTTEMLQAAQDCESDPWEWADIWQAMLAEILKE